MYNFPIGMMSNSFRGYSVKDAILKAKEIGADGIQFYATEGEATPENMSAEKRRELLGFMKDNGLVFSALCADYGHGFMNKDRNDEIIEKSKRIMDLAKDLECDIITTHIGVVPTDKMHPRYSIMQEACGRLAEYAVSVGSRFAVETGPERSIVLKEFLDSLHSKGAGVNLDPANLVMVTRDDPVQAVYNLKDYIVHTHAKDGINLCLADPEIVYGVMHPVPVEFNGVKFYEELPLGTGGVDFKSYLTALEDIGYRGFLTIEREVGLDPAADIEIAYKYLKNIING